MDYLFDIILIAIFILLIIIFALRGFLKTMFRLFRWFIAAIMAYFFGNQVATLLFEKVFYNAFLNSITEKVQAAYDGATAGFSGETIYQKLPFFLKTQSMKEKLTAIEEGSEMVNTISETLTKPIATIVSNIVGYLLVFLVAFLVFWLLTVILDKVANTSDVIKFINRFLGALIGATVGFLLIILAVTIVQFFFVGSPVYEHSFLVRWIGDSKFLQNLCDFNIGERLFPGT